MILGILLLIIVYIICLIRVQSSLGSVMGEGNYVSKRLDKILTKTIWNSTFLEVQLTYLERATSDHSPMLVQCLQSAPIDPFPFRFQRMWTSHRIFLRLINLWKILNLIS